MQGLLIGKALKRGSAECQITLWWMEGERGYRYFSLARHIYNDSLMQKETATHTNKGNRKNRVSGCAVQTVTGLDWCCMKGPCVCVCGGWAHTWAMDHVIKCVCVCG